MKGITWGHGIPFPTKSGIQLHCHGQNATVATVHILNYVIPTILYMYVCIINIT